MIFFRIIGLWGIIWIFGSCSESNPPAPTSAANLATIVLPDSTPEQDSIPEGLQRLLRAYPQQQWQATTQALIWPDGTTMPYRDSSTWPSFWDSLERPNLALQLAQHYPKGVEYPIPTKNHDPGRIRVDAFFRKMYGVDKKAVEARLVEVDFLGTKVRVTTVNNVHQRLKAVAKALEQHPEWQGYCLPTAGTFNWRPIAGTARLSSHSFGIAIDLNVQWANYWRWAVGNKNAAGKRPIIYKNRMPLGLIKLFEQEGFIWGGKWYHYDTMHFEYRPELLL